MLPVREPAFAARWAALLAIGGGLLGVLAFPRFGIWPAAIGSVAVLSVAVDGRRSRTGAWLGYVYGLAFMLPLVHWTGIYVGPAPWIILCAACAVFFAVLGAVLPVLARLPAGPVWVGCAWVLQEFLRDRIPFGGFPWGRLAFSQAESPLRWFAALGGAPLVTFVVAVAGGGLAVAVRAVRPLRARAVASGVAVAVVIPLLGLLASWPLAPAPDGEGRTMTVAVVQGGLKNLGGLDIETRQREVLDYHVRETLKLASRVSSGDVPRPRLVLWPENASDVDPFTDTSARASIERAVKAVGAPILVGAILPGPGADERRNVGILWSPRTGPSRDFYVKRHPVPFAEYIPLRALAEKVSSAASLVTRDMVAGSGDGLVRGGPVPIGDVICFEVAYDGLVRSSVAAGAQLLVVQTNNATFGYTAETYQQLAMGQLRAVETGRTVVQAATSGKSAIIGPDGNFRRQSGALFEPATLVDRVPVRSAQTLATRVGAWPEYLLTLAALIGAAVVVWSSRRDRPTPDNDAVPEHEMVTR